MKKLFLFLVLGMIFPLLGTSQTKTTIARPKVVIGLVVDQMREDYLWKFYNLYGETGFKRLIRDGYISRNTMVNYLPSHTAPGHTSIYTGSVPSIHGIAGNAFIENTDGRLREATEDKSVDLIGGTKKGSSSPKSMNVTTVGDELRLITNFQSRSFGIALKDRGSIFPAGRFGTAYWYDNDLGDFTTSTYYRKDLPKWLVDFNARNSDDTMIKAGWKTRFSDYSLSTEDDVPYEEPFVKETAPVFPHTFDGMTPKERNAAFCMTPYGNTYTVMMARALIEGEKLGAGPNTDFLAISFSSLDELAHQSGCNSIEIEDMMLKLDQDIAGFLSYLDQKFGAGNYLLFLTADHGGSHNQQYMKDHNFPAGVFEKKSVPMVNEYLKSKFGLDSLVIAFPNYYQFFLNNPLLKENPQISRPAIRQAIIDWALEREEVLYAIDLYNISGSNLPDRIKPMVMNGYNRRRGGDVQLILRPGWYEYAGKVKGNTHGTWSPADTHIPLIFYGWGVKKGETTEEHYTTDIAPTISSLLHIQMPNGCIGTPIQGVAK